MRLLRQFLLTAILTIVGMAQGTLRRPETFSLASVLQPNRQGGIAWNPPGNGFFSLRGNQLSGSVFYHSPGYGYARIEDENGAVVKVADFEVVPLPQEHSTVFLIPVEVGWEPKALDQAQIQSLLAGNWFVAVRTSDEKEIRGPLTVVPEPHLFAISMGGGFFLWWITRRQRARQKINARY